MKKLVIIALLALLPAVAFAQFGIGPAAFYNSPVLAGETIDPDDLDAEHFTFGANARLKLTLLHAEALALVSLSPFTSDIFLDIGAAVDIAVLRLSAGIGPKLTYTSGEGLFRGGYNLKVNADIVLGSISVGLSYIWNVTLDGDLDVRGRRGLLGFSVLFW